MIGPLGAAQAPPMYPQGIPPELFNGTGTVHSDIYQAGLTFYRAVNGDAFFKRQVAKALARPGGLQTALMTGRLVDTREFLPHVPRRLKTLIRKALAFDPADRFPTATDMADALGAVEAPLNWQPTNTTTGMRWVADRQGRFRVTVHTERQGVTRRKSPRTLWASGLTRNDVQTHLVRVFQAL
jgi:serine/threonine protein kinase